MFLIFDKNYRAFCSSSPCDFRSASCDAICCCNTLICWRSFIAFLCKSAKSSSYFLRSASASSSLACASSRCLRASVTSSSYFSTCFFKSFSSSPAVERLCSVCFISVCKSFFSLVNESKDINHLPPQSHMAHNILIY